MIPMSLLDHFREIWMTSAEEQTRHIINEPPLRAISQWDRFLYDNERRGRESDKYSAWSLAMAAASEIFAYDILPHTVQSDIQDVKNALLGILGDDIRIDPDVSLIDCLLEDGG